jgi:hypothetical protein
MNSDNHDEDSELDALAERLEKAGQLEREEIAEALELDDASAEAAAEEFMRGSFASQGDGTESGDPGARGPRPRSWRRWGALAAAILFALFLWRPWGVPTADPEILLGSRGIECLLPLGSVDRFDTFEWKGELPPGGMFLFTLWSEVDGAEAEPLDPPGTIDGHVWTPTDPSTLPPRVQWRVSARDATGVEVAYGSARSWLKDS